MELPKSLGGPLRTVMFHGSTAVPGMDQAFAWGWATTQNKSVDCVWHWSGGTTWKVTEASQLD